MDIYGLIGKKLGHSFSAGYFNNKFGCEGIDASYHLFEIPEVRKLPEVIEKYPTLRGLNVTIPYKQDVIAFLDSMTDSAREIGAVNTIRIERCGGKTKLKGHNTDAPGFLCAIRPMLPSSVTGLRALILGQGGASKAVIHSLEQIGVEITKVSRKASDETTLYEELSPAIISDHRIIVNCTPLGMWPEVKACPDIPYDAVTPDHICFDLVYNPEVTEFMRRCADQGASVSNGLRMLHNQADLAWKFWNNAD